MKLIIDWLIYLWLICWLIDWLIDLIITIIWHGFLWSKCHVLMRWFHKSRIRIFRQKIGNLRQHAPFIGLCNTSISNSCVQYKKNQRLQDFLKRQIPWYIAKSSQFTRFFHCESVTKFGSPCQKIGYKMFSRASTVTIKGFNSLLVTVEWYSLSWINQHS